MAEPLAVVAEVVLQLLLKGTLAERICYFGLLVIGLIHFPGGLEGSPVLPLEHMVRVDDEVVEVIGGPQHGNRNIIVVVARVVQIYFLTVVSDRSKLELDLLHNGFVLIRVQLIAGGRDVNQPPDQARLGVRNPHRLVGAHKEESLKAACIGRFEFLVHCHQLMGDQTVEPGIILNARQIPVVLDGHEGIAPECLQGECVAR